MNQIFIDGPYLLTFVGTTNGIVQCENFAQLHDTLHHLYPNPGDPTLAFLLNPANWHKAAMDDMPFFTEYLVDDGGVNDYRVAVYRVIKIEG